MNPSKKRGPSFGYLLAGGAVMWSLAGFVTLKLCISDPPEPLNNSTFPIKVAAVWAAAGLVLAVPLPTWFNMSYERCFRQRQSNPEMVAMLSTAARALLLGAGAGFVLASWVMPHLGLPEGLVLGNARSIWGAVFTALAYMICVPVAANIGRYLR